MIKSWRISVVGPYHSRGGVKQCNTTSAHLRLPASSELLDSRRVISRGY